MNFSGPQRLHDMKTHSRLNLDEQTFPNRLFPALGLLFRGQIHRLVVAGIMFIIKHSPVWAAPIITADIINTINRGGPGALEHCLVAGSILATLVLLNIPSHTLYARMLNGSIRTMEAQARMSLIRRLQQLNFGFHDQTRTGALQNKVLRDVESVGVLVSQIINTILSTLVGISIALVWTLATQPMLAVFYLLTVPVAVSIMQVFRSGIGANTQRYRKALEGMSIRITEMLGMITITRAHAAEEFEINRMSNAMDEVAKSGKRLDVLNGIFGATTWAIFQIFSLVSLLVSGWLALQGTIPLGDVILYQGFFMSITGGVSSIVNVMPDITKGRNAIGSIGEVLGSGDIEQNQGKLPVDQVRGDFAFTKVNFTYPGTNRQVIHELNLEVRAGETIAFVGESGSGKSSIMNLIIGFHRPDSGTIFLDGRDMAELDLRDYRRQLSLVSQNIILFSGTIRDNISYGRLEISEDQIRNALIAANAWNFIQDLPEGLDTMLGESGTGLSGGQRQRIAIARALIRDPRVIILDEATSALDVESERQVQAAIDSLIKGRTTFIVAHRLSTIRNADRIAVLKSGRLVEFGTHDELLARDGEFKKLYQLYR